MMEQIEYIRSRLSENAKWNLVAEEAAELAQAALKVSRILDGTNPVRGDFRGCTEKYLEEFQDVLNAFEILNFDDPNYRNQQKVFKLNRMEKALREAENRHCNNCRYNHDVIYQR